MKKINVIDLFAGCGGLMEGFESTNCFNTLACVEWEAAQCLNLRNRLRSKWHHEFADLEVIQFDMQRSDELINGFDDLIYGQHPGLNNLVNKREVDLIIGGPPCQAYSVAGRISDVNGMREDYRNYLFESYISIVNEYKPSFFVFENVPGILSAKPGGTPIIDEIKTKFDQIGYEIINNLENALFDISEYGVPQKRKRIIILGVNKKKYKEHVNEIIDEFYNEIMPSFKEKKVCVKEAIGDLPPLFPLEKEVMVNGKKYSHSTYEGDNFKNHSPRYHNRRDIEIFKILTSDIKSEVFKYANTENLKNLYYEKTNKRSNIHKYYVLRYNQQSNTIPAHLYKDGLRHIHPDPLQARSITVREAARLQTFPDDYEFFGSKMNQYKMIGNAVPPKFSKIIAKSIYILFNKYGV